MKLKGVVRLAIDDNINTQILLTLPKELLILIEDFQFENRIKSRSEATRLLIVKGLEKS